MLYIIQYVQDFIVLHFTEEGLILQNQMNYDYHCSLLTGPLASAEAVTYEINYRRSLNDISGFHVSSRRQPSPILLMVLEQKKLSQLRVLWCF